MGSQLLAAKIVIQEEEPSIRSIPGVPTAVCGMVAICERGPVAQATEVNSFEEYQRVFGDFTANGEGCMSAYGFFGEAGGAGRLVVVRTVRFTTITDKTTKTSTAGTLNLVDRAGTPLTTLVVTGKTDGSYSANVKIQIDAPSSGAADEFNLAVVYKGNVVEVFPNLKIGAAQASAARYVETIINDANVGSNYISVNDSENATASPNNLPALGLSAALSAGNDGLGSLADTDFVGAVGTTAGATGLRCFDETMDLSLLIVPGRATSTVHNGMITYCETTRDKAIFSIFDPPSSTTAQGMITYVGTTATLLELSEFAAIYWPRIKIANPSKAIYGSSNTEVVVPPSGFIAGVYARLDGKTPGGVYNHPAGFEDGVITLATGVETAEVNDESKRDLVFPKLINPIVKLPGTKVHVDGARTLKSTGNFPTIGERRGAIFIEQSLKSGLLFAKHKKITPALRAQMKRATTKFLLDQMKVGAFSSDKPSTAFFVDFGDALNTVSTAFQRKVIGRVGIATAKPAEYIVLRFAQDTRALDTEIAAAA